MFYFRVLNFTGWYRKVAYGVVSITVFAFVGGELLYALQCIPIAAFFDRASYPANACISTSVSLYLVASVVSFPLCLWKFSNWLDLLETERICRYMRLCSSNPSSLVFADAFEETTWSYRLLHIGRRCSTSLTSAIHRSIPAGALYKHIIRIWSRLYRYNNWVVGSHHHRQHALDQIRMGAPYTEETRHNQWWIQHRRAS